MEHKGYDWDQQTYWPTDSTCHIVVIICSVWISVKYMDLFEIKITWLLLYFEEKQWHINKFVRPPSFNCEFVISKIFKSYMLHAIIIHYSLFKQSKVSTCVCHKTHVLRSCDNNLLVLSKRRMNLVKYW